MTGTSDYVLIVEDHAETRAVVQLLVESFGYRARTAAHGRAALDVLERAEALPGLILLDLMMPVMDGWEFLEVLRQDPAWSALPVVVVSASGSVPEGIAGHLGKPMDIDSLKDTLQRFCQTVKARVPASPVVHRISPCPALG